MKSLQTYIHYRYGILCLFTSFFLIQVQAQPGNKWTSSPSDMPGKIQAFEKNLGQYTNPVNSWKVLYACNISGLTLLLTDHGLIYLADEYPHAGGDKEENEHSFRLKKNAAVIHHHLCIAWPGSNSHAMVEALEERPYYFSAPDAAHPAQNLNHIPAFKRILYHNLYPGIDLEFTFHPEQGIKYTLHVQPNADPNLFRMHYTGVQKTETDEAGNLHLHTDMGEFIDHHPVTTDIGGKAISSSFIRQGNDMTSFQIEKENSAHGLIIDPWLTSPTTGGFVPSDIGTDAANNTYIYGMQNIFSFSKLTYVQKYNPAGTLVWTYTFNQYPGASFQSDLAVDPAGNSYVASPYTYSNSTGNQYAMVCINTGGSPSYFYNTYNNSNISETWNLAYSCNYSTLIQAGCGAGAGNTSQVTIMTPSNGNVGQQYANTSKGEVFAGTVAPNGFYYAISADSSNGGAASSGPYDDLLCCKITGTTVTRNYARHLDYKYRDYTSKSSPGAIGTNGIAAGCGYLYTSDGYSLDQRDLLTGNLLKRVTITGGSNGSSSNGGGMGNATDGNVNSGIAVDLACGYVYAGSTDNVYIFDANLNALGSYAIPAGGIVYDVTLNNGLVSVCGATTANDGFVAQFAAKACPSLINITHVNASCGGNNGSATANPSFCVAPYSYSWNPGGQTTQTATGLAPGLYTVYVTTETSCSSVSDTVTIFNSGSLTASVVTTPTTCGKSNGSVSLTVTGGSAPYTYSWNTTPSQTTALISGLPAGTYSVSVKDAGGCAGTASGIIKSSAGGTLAITAHTNVSCFGGNNGSATATLTGGTAPITYTWAPSGGTTPTASGLVAGMYVITAKDSAGCTISDSVQITQPPKLILTTSSTPSSCAGPTGTATVVASGGKGTYTYSWNPGGATTAVASLLAAGSYVITVKDSNGCSSSATILVPSTSGITSAITASVNVLCAGGHTGSATVTVNGGHVPYTYTWSPSGGNTPTASGLAAGVYTVNAKDSAGCISTSVDTIHEPPPLHVIPSGVNLHCFNQCTGQVNCVASGGSGSYTYSWNTGCDSATCTSLCAGTYSIQVKDGNGCLISDSIIVTQPPGMNLVMYTVTSSCNKSNGSDSVVVSGGTPVYTYSWNPGPGSAKAGYDNLPAGIYTVTVKDAGGCTAQDTMRVLNTGSVTVSIPVSANVTCFSGKDGYAVALPSGGTLPYTYSWSPAGGIQDTAKNLGAGLYTVFITDSKGCQAQVNIMIQQPDPVVVAPMGPVTICRGQCSPLTATALGGTPGYTYTWTLGGTPQSSPACPLQTTTYTVVATDSKGCVSPPQTVIITVHPPLEVLTGNPVKFCAGGSASLGCTPSGGNGNYTYTWIPSTGLSSSTIQNPVASPAVTTTYTVILSDNCGTTTDSATVLVTVNPNPSLSFTANDTAGCVPLCVIFAEVSHPGCASATWTFGDGSTGNGCGPVHHCYSVAGTYSPSLSITDTAGCKASATRTNYIHAYPVPEAAFSFSPKPADIMNPTVYFTDLSTGASDWLWSFGELSGATSVVQNPFYTYKDTGCYTVIQIVGNAHGCKDTAMAPVCVIPIFTFYAPNAFTPNGDGKNDFWTPQGVGIDPDQYHLMLFDRWGNLIFETRTWGQGWDGRANGGSKIAQIDTYVWKADLHDFAGNRHSYSGICNLIK